MEAIFNIISIVLAGVGVVNAVVAWFKAIRSGNSAKAEKANADLLATAKSFIASAEVAFDGFDKMMKAQGSSAGAMKKDTVFTKLQAYALQNGYEFDADEWSKKIDELVAFTKNVNAKNI